MTAHRDPPRRRGLLGHDRGRLRAALLRRPGGARVARDPAHASTSRPTASPSRRTTRCAPRGLPPAGDRLHRPGAGLAADGAQPARRRVRLRRAAAARAAADHLGPAEPARRCRTSARSASASPPRPAATTLSQRLAKIDTAIYRRKRIEFEYYTMADARDGAAQASTRTSCCSRAGSSTSSATRHERDAIRVFRPRPHPRQGRLRDEGRARLPAPGRLRPARVRQPHPVAARRPGRRPPRCGSPTASPGWSSATSPLRRARPRRRRRPHLPHRLRDRRGC